LTVDLSLSRIEQAVGEIDPVFLDTPQFVSEQLSSELGREALVKVETLNPIGSFKGRGTTFLARRLDPALTWVCETAGNFGQGLAYAARERGASIHIFVGPDAPEGKVERMRSLGAEVETHEHPPAAAREYAAGDGRVLIVDGLDPTIAEGAGTIGVELAAAGRIDTAVIQLGDGALIAGVARWLKSRAPECRVIGVCASGAPAMALSFAAGRPVSDPGTGTIAGTLAITDPVPESLTRILALVDDVVLVGDDDMRSAMTLIAESLGVLVEPAGAAGVAALARHPEKVSGERVAILLTGAAA
jgi:threonine dehydratase